jgi:site-specific recombinase XerD
VSAPIVAPLIQAFFVEHLVRYKRASPQTVDSYRDAFRLLFCFLHKTRGIEPAALRLADLDAPSLLAFLEHLEQERGNGARSRNARLAAFRSFFRFVALREPSSLDLVTRALAIPNKHSDRRMVRSLARQEIEAILAAPDRATWTGRRDHALILTLYNSGARASEICALERARVGFGTSSALQLFGKGRKERAVPLWKNTARVLHGWFAELHGTAHPFAFPNARGRALTRFGVTHILRQAVQSALPHCPSLVDKRVSPHVVRHTTAMHLLQAGVDLTVIAMWLGHESLETTHIYVEADLAMKERALSKLPSPHAPARRFKADDKLMAFLAGL